MTGRTEYTEQTEEIFNHIYCVTFRWHDSDTYFTNIALANNVDDVKTEYSDYEIVKIVEIGIDELKEAQRKHMPMRRCYSRPVTEQIVKEKLLDLCNQTIHELREQLNKNFKNNV